MQPSGTGPVFTDPSGRRWRRTRGVALAVSVAVSLLALVLVAAVLIPPVLPSLTFLRTDRRIGVAPRLVTSRERREHEAARHRLFATLDRMNPPPAVRVNQLPVRPMPALPPGASRAGSSVGGTGADPIVAGFYVSWDDNSFASLNVHATEMDWVIPEWLFLAATGDSVAVAADPRVPLILGRLPAPQRPRVLGMVSNFDRKSGRFDSQRLRAMTSSPAATRRVASMLAAAVRANRWAGIVIDFEEIPDDVQAGVARFLGTVRESLDAPAAAGTVKSPRALLVQAVGDGTSAVALRAFDAVTDYTILMMYDEHDGGANPGPVASAAWYERGARSALAVIPPAKLILAVGAYGYDWNDGDEGRMGQTITFDEVMAASRKAAHLPGFDQQSGNPYLRWTDADSTDHVVWYLDGVTAYNEMRLGRSLGVAGHALWRLGSEDAAIWRVLGADGPDGTPDGLREIPPGYDVEFDGLGELIRVTSRPKAGTRSVTVDPGSRAVMTEAILSLPTPFIVSRWGGDSSSADGGRGKRIALTFDDGPDGSWSAAILDTLRAKHAPATFFVIGEHALSHPTLLRRMWSDGHEIGNHTYSHPNLGITPHFVTQLEIDATARLLEALLNRRTTLFRPPYFGDAEPTTSDELDPVSVATDLGYVTAGLHIDSQDWQRPSPQVIIDTVLAQRGRGSVVLLHDGGGDRSSTLAALGPLIDSLRARGDTLVLLSTLAGLTREQSMPMLERAGALERLTELATFGAIGVAEWGLTWLFLLAIVLGAIRLAVVTALAFVQRRRGGRTVAFTDGTYAPSVSVIVPAYNEEKVVVQTVASLLTQDYASEFEIVVVDDGSPDGTYRVALDAFAGHPKVTVLTKPNGGKASALTFGIARARGDIVIGLDADTLFVPGTITELVAPLRDPRVGAVAGNAKVGNRINLVTRWQAVEYVTSQNLDRRAFALLNCITVVPGAIGAWRKALVLQVGGFSDDTLAEDQDLTLAISRLGFHIAYADRAVAYTEAPDTFAGLAKQRFRWSFGTLQCMWKHRDVLGRRRFGALGLVAMPNVWIFQLLFAAVSPLADLVFLWSLVSVWLTWREHGATYAVTNLEQLLVFYAVFLIVDWVAAVIAFMMEPGEDLRLTWLIFLQRFAYRQVMYWVVVRSFVAALRGRIVGWGKLERKATVSVPTGA